VSDKEWVFVAAPYLTLCREDTPKRVHDFLQEVFSPARLIVRTGTQWRYMRNDFPHLFPPWAAMYKQAQR
jgi:transposase